MLGIAYVAGVIAVGFVATCCVLASEGAEGAEDWSRIGLGVLAGLASLALLLSFALMVAGPQASENDGWWSQGQGQQFLAAVGGWVLLVVAARSIWLGRFVRGAVFIVPAACLFGLWGLLVEAGWSDRGPLAVVSLLT